MQVFHDSYIEFDIDEQTAIDKFFSSNVFREKCLGFCVPCALRFIPHRQLIRVSLV